MNLLSYALLIFHLDLTKEGVRASPPPAPPAALVRRRRVSHAVHLERRVGVGRRRKHRRRHQLCGQEEASASAAPAAIQAGDKHWNARVAAKSDDQTIDAESGQTITAESGQTIAAESRQTAASNSMRQVGEIAIYDGICRVKKIVPQRRFQLKDTDSVNKGE